MAGVFDIDLDQPEENVSDDENEEVHEVVPAESVCARQRAARLQACSAPAAGALRPFQAAQPAAIITQLSLLLCCFLSTVAAD